MMASGNYNCELPNADVDVVDALTADDAMSPSSRKAEKLMLVLRGRRHARWRGGRLRECGCSCRDCDSEHLEPMLSPTRRSRC